MILENYYQLPLLRRLHQKEKISFCSGTFDLAHPGHGLFFEDAKEHSDLLVVLVANNSIITKRKGQERPVYNQYVRLKAVDLMKPVDYCILQSEEIPDKRDYLSPLYPVLEKLKPNRWVFNSDAFDIEKRKGVAKKYGVEMVILERRCPPEFENISTTSIIEKIRRLK